LIVSNHLVWVLIKSDSSEHLKCLIFAYFATLRDHCGLGNSFHIRVENYSHFRCFWFNRADPNFEFPPPSFSFWCKKFRFYLKDLSNTRVVARFPKTQKLISGILLADSMMDDGPWTIGPPSKTPG